MSKPHYLQSIWCHIFKPYLMAQGCVNSNVEGHPRAFQTLEAKFDISDSSKVHEAVLGSAGQASVLGTTQFFRALCWKKMPVIFKSCHIMLAKRAGQEMDGNTIFVWYPPFVGKSSCFCSLLRLPTRCIRFGLANVYYTMHRTAV